MNTAASNKTFFKTFLAIGIAISLAAVCQTEIQTEAFLKIRTRYKWAILMVVFALNAVVALLMVLWPDRTEKIWERLSLSHRDSSFYRISGVLLTLLPLPLLWFARQEYFGNGLEAFFRLLWLFWWLALVQAAGIKLIARASWPIALAVALLFNGVLAADIELSVLNRLVGSQPLLLRLTRVLTVHLRCPSAALGVARQPLPDAGGPVPAQWIAHMGGQTLASRALVRGHGGNLLGLEPPSASFGLDRAGDIRRLVISLPISRRGLLPSAGMRHHHISGRFSKASVALTCGSGGGLRVGGYEPPQLVPRARDAGDRALFAGGTGI
jgi:hypothetical protein